MAASAKHQPPLFVPLPLPLRSNVFELRYEEVQQNERAAMLRLFSWLGAPPSFAEKDRREETAKKTSEDLRDVLLNFANVQKFLVGLDVPPEKCPLLEMSQAREPRVFHDCDFAFLAEATRAHLPRT
mmetsp:Transcript_46037/g.92918  ORF Transcript_46037/g.92918 Transcript_46037/m.92918 type:complete len:127 (+) Transcript_46037:190-570(+)